MCTGQPAAGLRTGQSWPKRRGTRRGMRIKKVTKSLLTMLNHSASVMGVSVATCSLGAQMISARQLRPASTVLGCEFGQ